MKDSIIFVDICNTLADVNREIENLTGCKRPAGLYFHPSVCPNWFLEHIEVFENCKPIAESLKGLKKLAEKNDIVYLTARPIQAHMVTVNWLKRNGYPDGPVYFSERKAEFAESYLKDHPYDRVAFIDDAPHEILSCIQMGYTVFVHRQDYNLHFKNVFSWNEEGVIR